MCMALLRLKRSSKEYLVLLPPGWVGGVVDTNLAGPRIDWATRGYHRCGYHGGGRVPVRCAWAPEGCQQARCVGVQKTPKCWGCWLRHHL